MTFDEWKIKYDGDIVNVADVFFSYERGADSETCYDELYWILKKAFNAGKKNAPKWHYPSKGEFPNDCETVLGYAIKNEHKMLVEIYLRDGDWQLANGMLGLEYRIIAWQYLPEPPKEE